ncbi:lactate racemase domain-containing protein [Halodesulfovibrio aestuarii]|uniref:lactate racemase domain-containing protein n=1 Tax=Halodesulfovibrio aestuarii TaxID=126333 RepID=UPI003D332D81
MPYPIFYDVEQTFETSQLDDIAQTVDTVFASFDSSSVKQNARIGITVGSRGIDRIVPLLQAVVRNLKIMGLRPFIIPSMGSHGGSTAEGQTAILAKLGITEESAGCPIVSSIETVSLGTLNEGAEVFVAKDALEADYIFVMNRVKPHTLFHGEVESGLCKMLAIGLGKPRGADNLHNFPLEQVIKPAALRILENITLLAGLAVVENAVEQLHSIRLCTPEDIVKTDSALLSVSSALLPRIPVDSLDLLIIDEMGKNISGTGMDTNVIGTWRRMAGERKPEYKTLVVLNLTPQSQGNAHGIGMADLIPQRLADSIDPTATYANSLTTGVWASGRLPITLPTDKAVIDAALAKAPEHIRAVRITNTLSLQHFWATEAVLDDLAMAGATIHLPCSHPLEFDDAGTLQPFYKLPDKT